MTPIGAICPYMGPLELPHQLVYILRQGWLPCDGRTLRLAEFPDLGMVLGNRYGGDDLHFALPDLRGMFLRGTSPDSETDPDRDQRAGPAHFDPAHKGGVGSTQQCALQTHTHAYQAPTSAPPSAGGEPGALKALIEGETGPPEPAAVAGKETRPVNIAVNYLIRCR